MAYEFTDEDKVSGSWIKWDEVGTKVQGTLIGRRQKPDTYDPTKMQWIYELLTEDDEIVIVGGKPGIDMQMKHVRLGQIVELRYEGEKPAKQQGHNPTKLIQVYTSKDAMDKEWLEQNSEMLIDGEGIDDSAAPTGNTDGEIKVEEITEATPVATPATATTATVDPKRAQISELAKTKLKVVNEADVEKIVMESTGLAFIESNLDQIIEKLTAM